MATVGSAVESHVCSLVVPGDVILDLETAGDVVRLGGGLKQEGNFVVAARAGALRCSRKGLQWVDSDQKRKGALVFARLLKAHPDMAPEITCVDGTGAAAQFGPLTGGTLFDCSTRQARMLLGKPTLPVISLLNDLPFEFAVGVNGRVWVNSGSALSTIHIAIAIQDCVSLPSEKHQAVVKQCLRRISEG